MDIEDPAEAARRIATSPEAIALLAAGTEGQVVLRAAELHRRSAGLVAFLAAYDPVGPEGQAGMRGPGQRRCGSKGGALDERGKPFRRSTFGRKWRKARSAVGLADTFRFYDLRHTGHTLTTRSGATLKDTMVRAGQSTEKAALIYQHSDPERQREVASGLDSLVQAERRKAAAKADEQASGTERARDA
ncbi:hypothetical protein [Streptomyces sp. NPDC060366]|uniref:hypothetical protein n=1 Tax=Streptomyces sp. NPDC060366 TaxID=3347105 RepID=UPI00365F3D61